MDACIARNVGDAHRDHHIENIEKPRSKGGCDSYGEKMRFSSKLIQAHPTAEAVGFLIALS
jgi:hypothetical protein